MSSIDHLLRNNQAWAAEQQAEDPQFFEKLAQGHNPDYLWFGCVDARVHPLRLLGLDPGTLLVHRNIANQVLPSDPASRATLQFAVHSLGVKDIIVCGHHACGGIQAALNPGELEEDVRKWVDPITRLYRCYQDLLDGIPDPAVRSSVLAAINVNQQVWNVARTRSLQQAWRKGREVSVHGILFNIQSGLLQSLDLCISNSDDLERQMREASTRIVKSSLEAAGVESVDLEELGLREGQETAGDGGSVRSSRSSWRHLARGAGRGRTSPTGLLKGLRR